MVNLLNFRRLKKQHVRDLAQGFRAERMRFRSFQLARRLPGAQPQAFALRVDLRSLSPITTPIKPLGALVFEQISVGPRALALAAQLAGALDGLSHAMKTRQELIDEQRQLNRKEKALCSWYLGFQIEDVIDARFSMNVTAIERQTDDCIFFSKEMGYELARYGDRLRRRKTCRGYIGLPKVIQADWGDVESAGLFPPDGDYESWFAGFKKRPGLLQRLKAFAKLNER